ncbi:hypothetical protein QAD02_000869 [Eretmocerus hayati]|uniref:Uncharacterized protein n=1 Tax=Eretmocerus hayati TaxID=131215 RepID=A0ACC2NEH6_9HYME|nr:hypothetical protein QAD02_000869 [Eretmocerus hayati]
MENLELQRFKAEKLPFLEKSCKSILDSGEQIFRTDYNRHLEQLVKKTENLLIQCLKTKVSKENISEIEKYQSLIERVRDLSYDDCENVTMAIAAELFLDKIDGLTNLLKNMKNFDSSIIEKLEDIESDLKKLRALVEQDKCLNAGGKFEWVDSVLVKCLQEGTWLLIDQVNLCSPAVLDRLNGLLEPNGVLSIGERGVDNDGNVVTVKPHKNFRLFLTMDPKFGEISRAMRNRGVEIFMLASSGGENIESCRTAKLDHRSLLYESGIRKRNHQEALMTVHRRISEEPFYATSSNDLSVMQLLQAAFLVSEQLARGFPCTQAFRSACLDAYLRSRPHQQLEIRQRLINIIEDTIQVYQVDESDEYVFELDAATPSLKSLLYDNSALAQIRQQGLLMSWCARGYLWLRSKRESEDTIKLSLKTDFINELFGIVEGEQSAMMSLEVLDILPHILLNFYEHSSRSDASLRMAWISQLFKDESHLELLDEKSCMLADEVLSFDFRGHPDQLPWDSSCGSDFIYANNLSLLLYYQTLVVDDEMQCDWRIDKSSKLVSVAQFSQAHREGKMTIKLKDQPIITNYVTFVLQVNRYIDYILRRNEKMIDVDQYIKFRLSLNWYGRFCELGKLTLLDKSNESNLFNNLDEVILQLKVHYKWLKKLLKMLEVNYEEGAQNEEFTKNSDALKEFVSEIDNSLMSVYDPFRKICKLYKKHMNSPLPCSSQIVLDVRPVMQNITDSLSPSRNKYFSSNLANERKFVVLQANETLKIRSKLISLWTSCFVGKPIDEDISRVLQEMSEYCATRLDIADFSKETTLTSSLSSKKIAEITSNVQLWPIHEYMFTVFVGLFQRRLSEKLANKDDKELLPSALLFFHHVGIPNITIELIAVLNAISIRQNDPDERNRLLFALYTWFFKYHESSYAMKGFKQISHWSYNETNNSEDQQAEDTDAGNNLSSGPVLVNLVSELLLGGSGSGLSSGVTLGNYNSRLRQLKLLSDLLWKNSESLNSPGLELERNDLQTLRGLLNSFLQASESVEAEERVRISLETSTSSSSAIDSEYVKPLAELRIVSESLDEDASRLNRGKAWALVGYLQAFVFGNMGYIDPVHKVALKLRYLEQDVEQCRSTIYVAELYSRIMGVADKKALHPRLGQLEVELKHIEESRDDLQRMKAVRPAHADFIAMSREFANFRVAIGSYDIVDGHIQRLVDATTDLENEVSESNMENAKSAKRGAEMWLESLRRFMDQFESRYSCSYPDIVFPILSGLSQLRHGISILTDECSSCIAISETSCSPVRLECLTRELVRFPSLSSERDNLPSLATLYSCHETRELLASSLGPNLAPREQFRLALVGLRELKNYAVLRRSLDQKLMGELDALLEQLVLIWKQQRSEAERQAAEKDSLYARTQILGAVDKEEEETIKELKSLFPTHHESDFGDVHDSFRPSLEQRKTVTNELDSDTKGSLGDLISDQDIVEVQAIHSSIVRSFTSSEWLSKIDNMNDRADHLGPWLQRYQTFSLLLNKVSPALSSELNGQLHTSLNVLAHVASRLGQGENIHQNEESEIKNDNKPYDYYRHSNVEEVRQCSPLLETITVKLNEILQEWPEHPTLLSINVILHRIYSFPVTSPLARFLTGLELLLVKLYEWEENAHSDVSLSEHIVSLTQQIIKWRQLELACWSDSLSNAALRLRNQASKWWFFLYDLFQSYVRRNDRIDDDKSNEAPLTASKMIETLEKFISESPFAEFEARLELLLVFHCHVYYLDPCIERDELLAISWNVFNYYNQFSSDVSSRISAIKAPIEKKLKDFVKIARWNDINYWAVKEAVEKTHRTLHKFIKEFENGLKDLVTPYLVAKPNYQSQLGIWDHPDDIQDSVDPNDYVTNVVPNLVEISSVKSNLIAKADSHYLAKAKQLCQETILTSLYPGIRASLEEFIEEFRSYSARLRTMEIDRTLPQQKQKSQAKNILQQKRLALSDYFKALTQLGLSHRVGSLAWKNKLEEVLDFTIPPVNVQSAFDTFDAGRIEKKISSQWRSCDRYYYGSLIRLNALNRSLASNKTDLGAQNIEWCRGFSTHLMLLANQQRKNLATILKNFINLKTRVSSLSQMDMSDIVIKKHNDIWNCSLSLKELFTTVQTSLEQFLVYLQAGPEEQKVEGEDRAYFLVSNNSKIVCCKKGDAVWEQSHVLIKECLSLVGDINKNHDQLLSKVTILEDERESEVQVSVITTEHFQFLLKCFDELTSIKNKMHEFASQFGNSEVGGHPLLENIRLLETKCESKIAEFQSILSPEKDAEQSGDTIDDINLEGFEDKLEKLMNMILIAIQTEYKKNTSLAAENVKNDDEDEDEDESDFEKNKLKEKLIESIENDIKLLKMGEINQMLNSLLKEVSSANSTNAHSDYRLLQKCMPLVQQYLLLAQFYLNEQVASFRVSCKILHMQLNVFLDLATNGFCVPKNLDLEEGEEGSEEKAGQGGMGLGDGEGEKDVSEQIETEDQLEDAKPAGQEKDNQENKECPEEDKGIEMSEDFEGVLQDVEQKEDEQDDKDKDEDEDMDKEMGETADGADKLDEQIWGDDEEQEPESDETKKDDNEMGDGEETGEKEFGAKDDNPKEDPQNQENDGDEVEKEQQKEINEMEEPEYDEDQVNPYHGQHQPEPEPEPFDLPEDVNMEDDDVKDDEPNNEENPFDIDKMKEDMAVPEAEENVENTQEEEEIKEDTAEKHDSSDDEEDTGNEKPADDAQVEDKLNEDETKDETMHEAPKAGEEEANEEKEPEESPKDETEDKAVPSADDGTNETDAAQQVDQQDGGSHDQVAQAEDQAQQDSNEEAKAENWQDENIDKGTGQSQAEQQDAGHSGSSLEKSQPTADRDIESDQVEKRKNPGKSDESHTLAEEIEPDQKKLKTMIHAQENIPDDENKEEGAEQGDEGEPDICQHVKENEKFDHYAMDAATEEQSKEQASNTEQKEDDKVEEEPMDVDMHEDEDIQIIDDESTVKQNAEQVSEEEPKDTKDSKEKGRIEDGQLETVVDVEGEFMETTKVERGNETAFYTNMTDISEDLLTTRQIETKRMEVETMLSQWTQVPTTEEAVVAWNTLSAVTDVAARDLSEKLRLVLEPTQASRLKGDYRTGRRINMRKIIPYIASQFRKDKIWLRRTKPSKRDYQIVLAIDDSSSMADNHSKELAFESLSLISKAMTYLEAGQLSVLSFGEEMKILHPLGETFSEQSGSRLMQEMRFEQKKTMIGQLVDFTVDMFESQSSSSDNAKLLVVLSDGRGIFSEGPEKVNRAVRRARLADIFLVFIIVDNPMNKDSILDIRMPIFQDGKLIGIYPYMDTFPFPFYMILRDINSLPGVLSDALRQWFEVVGKIDT